MSWATGKKILTGFILLLIVTNFALVEVVNISASNSSTSGDQGFYLLMGIWIKERILLDDGSRHPLYAALTSLFARRDLRFFTQAKLFTMTIGLVTLLTTFVLARRLHNAEIALLATFLLSFDFEVRDKASMVSSEPLTTLLFLAAWYFAVRGFEPKRHRLWMVAGFTAGLAYLSKGTGQFILVAFLLSALLLYGKAILKRKEILLFPLFYLIPASCLYAYNFKVYGNPIFNYSTNHVMWLDDWEAYYAADFRQLPTMSGYLRSHSIGEMISRQWMGMTRIAYEFFCHLLSLRLHLGCNAWKIGLALVVMGLTAVALVYFRKDVVAYARDNRERLVFTAVLSGLLYGVVSWYFYTTGKPFRFLVPLFPLVHLFIAEWVYKFGARLWGGKRLRSLAYPLFYGGLALALVAEGLGCRFENPFQADRAANVDELAVMSWLADTVEDGAVIVYEPSHALPFWLSARGLASVPFIDWGNRRTETTYYRPPPAQGAPRYIFAPVPYVPTWSEFVAYLRENNARYLILTRELLDRRSALLGKYFQNDRKGAMSILALPSDWELALPYKDLPCVYCLFRLNEPGSGEAASHALLGDELRSQGDLEGAIAEYKKAIERGGDWAGLYAALGRAYQSAGQPAEALTAYRQAITLKPDDAWYRYLLGETCRAQGERDEAIAQYEKAIDLTGDDWPVLHAALGDIYESLGQPQEALAHYQRAVQLDPQDPLYYKLLGDLYRSQDRNDQAIAAYERAIELGGDDWPELHIALGHAYEDTGQSDEAVAHYEKAHLWPDHEQRVSLGGRVLFLGYDLENADGNLGINLYWRCLERMDGKYLVYLKLINDRFRVWGQADGPPDVGGMSTRFWKADMMFKGEWQMKVLPGTPPGLYHVEVILYDPGLQRSLEPEGGERLLLGPVELTRREAPTVESLDIEHPLEADLGGQVRLLGYNIESGFRPGDGLHLTLFWQAARQMDSDYTVFVHLNDEAGRIRSQSDSQPVDGLYPTGRWQEGEIVRDQYDVLIPAEAAPGEYRLEVGMYLAESGARLPVSIQGEDVGDSIVLETVVVK